MNDPDLNVTLKELLNDLDGISDDHPEIGDTDCREQMFDAVHNAFLKPVSGYTLPHRFGLYSDEGNARVRAALERYASRARARAEEIELNAPNDRLAAFNAEVYSDNDTSADEYFGWMDSIE